MEATETARGATNVYLVIGSSYVTRTERGEIIETVETLPDGQPDWDEAGVCDGRGAGGHDGFAYLDQAIRAAESNAQAIGLTITRVKD